jgi:hypothetical protein
MSVAANMNFIWGSIANGKSTMLQTESGPMRINSIRTKFGTDLEISLKDADGNIVKLVTVNPSNCASIRESMF